MSTGLLSLVNVSEAMYMQKIICIYVLVVLGVSAFLQVQIGLTRLTSLIENVCVA